MWKWYQLAAWKLFSRLYGPLLKKKYNLVSTGDETVLKPPYVLIGNHSHALDPYFIAAFSPHPIHYMANIDGVSPFMQKISKITGAFPKAKGRHDFSAVRRTFDIIKQGEVVGIFPEGDRSWDGSLAEIPPSAANLIKKLGVSLRIVRLKGNYLSGPRWSKGRKKGNVILENTILDAPAIKAMDAEELYRTIEGYLSSNDIKDPELRQFSYQDKDLAEGIERLLWVCPACHNTDCLTGHQNEIHCKSCGLSWELNSYLEYHPHNNAGGDLKDWQDWQLDWANVLVSKDDFYEETSGVSLYRRIKGGTELIGEGKISINREQAVLSKENEPIISFPIRNIKEYVDNFNNYFEFSCNRQRYRILYHGSNALKWIMLLDAFHRMDHGLKA